MTHACACLCQGACKQWLQQMCMHVSCWSMPTASWLATEPHGSMQIENEKVSRGEEAAGPDAFDSNCITPGTPFMQRLGEHLRFFIRKKISEDPAWQVPVIVFSGLCSDSQKSSQTTCGVLH